MRERESLVRQVIVTASDIAEEVDSRRRQEGVERVRCEVTTGVETNDSNPV